MMSAKTDQSPLLLASKFVNSTDRNIFLTGKAGTGKTTFLKKIVQTTHKKVMVAAPTGIAAINAGGVTLHSLFQLPFGSFLPSSHHLGNEILDTQISTPQSIKKSLRMHSNKRKLINEMEVLIIDEVSMLRADILDAIDTVLRYVRKRKATPFGGVQMVFIGDLLQLPPVIKQEEKKYLEHYYSTGFFFEARALQEAQPLYIELEKIFRQTDKQFIEILNHFRDNTVTSRDLDVLNRHYQPSFKPKSDEGYIFITTHNNKADSINRRALKNLPGKPVKFHARIEGDFNKHLYPIDYTLELKKGAQVMFIKNDYSGEQRYFNGKIGTVTELSDEDIEVSFDDGTPPTAVESYTWENKRYVLNKNTNEIEENIKGTFTHFPIKLAWAITVHKSQGLTFQKAIIDVSQAFAPGQIYVALSRLVSLEGLVLNAPLPYNMLEPHEALKHFSENKLSPETLEKEYHNEFPGYICNYISKAFDFQTLDEDIKWQINSYYKDEKRSAKQKYKNQAVQLREDFKEIKTVGDKFQIQLKRMASTEDPQWLNNLQKRVKAAKEYFEPRLEQCAEKIRKHISQLDYENGVKKYVRELRDLEHSFNSRIQSIQKSEALIDAVLQNKELTRENLQTQAFPGKKHPSSGPEKQKQSKGSKKTKTSTKEVSWQMFQKGKTIEEIAAERSLAVSTIEGHLSHWVREGSLPVEKFVNQDKLEKIIHVARELDSTKLTEIKARLGDEFTYSDLKFAMAHYRYNQEQK
ncbi:MAG: helix-turn-helix domain-containing protein [Bacteroidales bacterium]|nr:helix-turn-helix domain-containing protein [Bacteroidales bacterium]